MMGGGKRGKKMRLNKVSIITILSFLVIGTAVFAASENYYAKTEVYFNIPYDAAFRIAMPSTYTYNDITGTDYATATATSPGWISFNFTQVPSRVEPYAGGLAGDTQSGLTKPIFMYNPTGNTPINISINLTSIPTGTQVEVNGVCGGTGSCTIGSSLPVNLTANVETLIVGNLATNSYFNCTLYGYADDTASPGESLPVTLYHHSTIA